MGEVDPAFIQDLEHRPKLSIIQAEGIPIIDLSPISNHTVSDPSSIENLVKQIGSACKEWGFFQVTNHGVPLTLRQNIEKASRLFFAQNLEEKRKVSRDESSPNGYYDTEHTKNIRDWKEVFDFQAKDPTFIPVTFDEHDDRVTHWTNHSPQYPPNFRVIIQEYIQEMEKLCFKLLELIALSLGIEANRFEEFFIKNQTSSIRLNHYPPCPYPGLALGVGRHKDPGALTILAQDEVGGLEVKRKADQEWIGVKPTLDAYIINVGDIIQRTAQNLSKYTCCKLLTQSPAMGEVDAAFIQDPPHRPKLSTIQAEGIPIIDLSPITNHRVSDPSAIEGLVKEIGSACNEWGFFQVTNHGVPLTLRQNIEKASKLFFAQSAEEKRKVSRNESSPAGYYDTEHTKNVRDWKEVFDFLAKEPTFIPVTSDEHDDRVNQWTNQSPEYPLNFRVVTQEYIQEMEKLSFKILELIALSLGLEAKRFEEFFIKDQTSFIRLNHYPPCPYPDLALGVGRHKDPGALTILAQDEVGGLEVRRKADQEWIRVKPTPDAYIINIGDTVQVWSNDAYESVDHRVVVNSEKERFSIPFFFFPAHDTEVKPLEELINEQNPSKYRPYKWGKFLVHRGNSNFKKQNEENIQIYHYKIA
ncbi:Protein DMR6-LIKE OXYGENASE 1 [Glycine max]|nr:Protein DMR6-LIKE OXYGENASE 1 [Glycine max]